MSQRLLTSHLATGGFYSTTNGSTLGVDTECTQQFVPPTTGPGPAHTTLPPLSSLFRAPRHDTALHGAVAIPSPVCIYYSHPRRILTSFPSTPQHSQDVSVTHRYDIPLSGFTPNANAVASDARFHPQATPHRAMDYFCPYAPLNCTSDVPPARETQYQPRYAWSQPDHAAPPPSPLQMASPVLTSTFNNPPLDDLPPETLHIRWPTSSIRYEPPTTLTPIDEGQARDDPTSGTSRPFAPSPPLGSQLSGDSSQHDAGASPRAPRRAKNKRHRRSRRNPVLPTSNDLSDPRESPRSFVIKFMTPGKHSQPPATA
ncbi:hypothetical protein C8Q76DRAFT_790208 [Earliella scabrosa]|nr:hypothetical protein C8Q76DRAFT_790208 [Earliella scabrosa]